MQRKGFGQKEAKISQGGQKRTAGWGEEDGIGWDHGGETCLLSREGMAWRRWEAWRVEFDESSEGKTVCIWIRTHAECGAHGFSSVRHLLTSSGHGNTVEAFSKPSCFWKVPLATFRQVLKASSANPFQCRFYTESNSSNCLTICNPSLTAEARVT